jgi:hypothetical protein
MSGRAGREATIGDALVPLLHQELAQHEGGRVGVDADARMPFGAGRPREHHGLAESRTRSQLVLGHARADDEPSDPAAERVEQLVLARLALLGVHEEQVVAVLERHAVGALHHVGEVRVADVQDHTPTEPVLPVIMLRASGLEW